MVIRSLAGGADALPRAAALTKYGNANVPAEYFRKQRRESLLALSICVCPLKDTHV
jgi:hypothetical protein